jgi:hypothetical protein
MGIKPALGWLGVLLFATTAQAGGAQKLLDGARSSKSPPVAASVTPKTKGPPAARPVAAEPASTGTLTVVESTVEPRGDYEAESHSRVPLDSPLAKARGYDAGLVFLVFERQRRAGFRVERDRIRRVVRLAPSPAVVAAAHSSASAPRAHVDVLETEDGVIAVDTTTDAGGVFATSDVYVFPRNATLDQRIGALRDVPSPARERLREALVAAEWAPITDPK